LTLIELGEGTHCQAPLQCCGSAGTYNLEHPDIAAKLGERKARDVLATGADVVASGNIGCITQLRNHLAALGASIPVLHTVQLLDQAYSAIEWEARCNLA
ncbi:MAG: heterodisulfide reductase-related iron-sulfur binding cluster, partial [Ardenticatenaceae bacterium]